MNIGEYRKNVLKTTSPKSTKMAVRTLAKNTHRTMVASQLTSLAMHTGRLLEALSPYILGAQFTPTLAAAAYTEMGVLSMDLVILSKLLKVKLPTGTKKLKLSGTRTAALLHLFHLSNDMLAVVHEATFEPPPLKTVSKMVNVPHKGKESRQVEVVDGDEVKTLDGNRTEHLQTLLAQTLDTYWRLSFDMFKHAPQPILDDQMKAIAESYPTLTFHVPALVPVTA